jgi:phosphoadenosine phosphosulfate reductase
VNEIVERTQALAESWSVQELLQWSFKTFGHGLEMASGFGVEGMVLIDIATRVNPKLRVFTIDTDFLFPDTYELIERTERRYGLKIERLRLDPEDQAEIYGPALWRSNPDQCCGLRSGALG